MKTKTILFVLFSSLLSAYAQNRTKVNSTSSEISDNLDLRAIASIFGKAENLDDFERQLNDPEIQISNLDLNNDNEVDYLRVIESVERNTHLIIIQSVLGRDSFQDVATIELEKDRNNNVSVQIVGDVYMYGDKFIYEPIYQHTPFLYASFWRSNYNPYYSSWYWNNYPTYYNTWSPFPVFRYRNKVNLIIDNDNHYNYVNVRNSRIAINLHDRIRENQYERQYPNRSFAKRNSNYKNRQELYQDQKIRFVEPRNRGNRNRFEISENNRANTRLNNPAQNQVNPRQERRINSMNSVSSTDNSTNSNRENTASRSEANWRTKTNDSRKNNETNSNSQNNTPQIRPEIGRTRTNLRPDNSQNRNLKTDKDSSNRGLR